MSEKRPVGRPKEACIDWAGIERLFRTSLQPVRAIAREMGVTEGAIRYQARRRGWVRAAEAARLSLPTSEALAQSGALNPPALFAADEGLLLQPPDAQPESDAVLGQQREDVGRARRVVRQLFEVLGTLESVAPDLEQLGALMRCQDAKGMDRLNELYQKVIGLPSQVEMAKRLADTLKLLIELESKVLQFSVTEETRGAAHALAAAAPMNAMEAYARMCEGEDV